MGKKGGGGGKGGKKGNKPKGKGRGNESKPAQVALPPGEVTPKAAGQMMPEGYAVHPPVSSLPPHLQAEAMQQRQMQQWQMQMNYQHMQMQMMQMYGQMPMMAQAWPTDASMTGPAPMSPEQVLVTPKALSTPKAESASSNGSMTLFAEPAQVQSSANGTGKTPTSPESAVVGEHVDIDPWERYEEVKELGDGANGKVKLARDRQFDGRFVAIKRLVCGKSTSKDYVIERELDIMKKLEHKNICRLFETYLHGRHRYFIMEYLPGGELLEELMDDGPMLEEDAKGIFRQIADALAYAHDNGVAHRDLRPENICFASKSERLVKVIDWGHGVFMSPIGRTATPNVGTYFYQAPEVQGASGGQTYTNACDLWSLGALLYVMVSGRMPPWVLGSHQDTLQAKKDENIPMTDKEWETISEEAKSLIKSMLKADPEERLPTKEVLQHPWLLKQD